jgi:hypothetical protein
MFVINAGAHEKTSDRVGVLDFRQDTSDVPVNIGQDIRDVPAHFAASLSNIGQDTRDVPAPSVASLSNIGQDTRDVPTPSVASLSNIGQNTRDVPIRSLALINEDDHSSDDATGDVTIMADKGKGREVDSDQSPTTESVLAGIDLEPFRPRVSGYDPTLDYKLNALPRYQDDVFGGGASVNTQDEAIPLDRSSIMSFYNSSQTVKRDREESVESRQSKIHRRSTSHSAAPSGEHSTGQSVPSTRAASQDKSVTSSDSDRYGASRTTGGTFRGRAIGNVLNWGDTSMYFCLYTILSNFSFFLPFSPSDAMEVDTEAHQQTIGKVLLYTSQERDTRPAMTMKLQTTSELPLVLDKLALMYSPIQSKYIISISLTIFKYPFRRQ